MKIARKLKILLEIITFIILIFFDQLTKYLAVIKLQNNESVTVIKNVINLTYLENKGAAFGIFEDKIVFFAILTIIILSAIVYFKVLIDKVLFNSIITPKIKKKYLTLSWVLVFLFSGAVGNFIDRLRFNYVVDFIQFKFINFPVFNFADILITCSSGLLIILLLFVFKTNDLEYLNKKGKK